MSRLIIFSLLLAVTTPALAVDGVLEINQTCAVQTGCFAGDTAGFPVTISAPGSYRLTSNLSVSNVNRDGIHILTDGVSIDLNGFEIAGPGSCAGSGSSLSCTSGLGIGISAHDLINLPPTKHDGITVKNGTVRGFGDAAINVDERSAIRNVLAEENGSGIVVGTSSMVIESRANRNGGPGINANAMWNLSGRARG